MSVLKFYRGGESVENNKNLRDMVLEHQLKSIYFDFEKKVFEINGINIGYCTDVDICFHDSKWSISLCENKNYNVSGFMVKKDTSKEIADLVTQLQSQQISVSKFSPKDIMRGVLTDCLCEATCDIDEA